MIGALVSYLLSLVPVGLIVWIWWHGHRYAYRATPVISHEDHGERYALQTEVHPKNGSIVSYMLSFQVPMQRQFRIRHENWFDRLSKFVRLTKEVQTTDLKFDANFFLDSRDSEFLKLIQSRNDLRKHLNGLLSRMNASHANFWGLECEAGWLQLRINMQRVENENALRREAVTWLAPLLTALRELPHSTSEKVRDPHQQMKLPKLISLLSFFFGIAFCLFLFIFGFDHLLEPGALFHFCMLVACVPIAIFFIFASIRTAYTANRHRLMLIWLFAAVPGIVMLTFFSLRNINIYFDFHAPHYIAVQDATISTYYQRKLGEKYKLSFNSEHPSIKYAGPLDIDRGTYLALQKKWRAAHNEKAWIKLHQGALGFAWIDIAK